MSRIFLDVGPRKPSDRVGGGGGASSSVADFPSLQFVFVISSGLLENFLRDSYGSRKEGCPYMSYCGDFPEVHLKLSSFSLKDFGKEAVLILVIPSQKNGKKN